MYRSTLQWALSGTLALLLVLAGCDSTSTTPNRVSDTPSDDVEQTSPDDVIPGQYIVVLNDEAVSAKSKEAVRRVARQLLGKSNDVLHVYDAALTGFAASNLTAAQVDALERNARVDYVEPDRRVTLSSATTSETVPAKFQTTPWGVQRVNGPADASGKTAWIIDTGIDLDHPDLNVNTAASVDFTGSGNPDDGNGHGTHVAGVVGAVDNNDGVVGVAANASLVAVKVLSASGAGTYSQIINGVNHVATFGSPGDVANMSLGGGYSQALNDAVANAASSGIYFALVGCGSLSSCSPGSLDAPYVVTITAMNRQDEIASFADYTTPSLDYASPGVNIYSTDRGGGYATLSGESTAAPHVAGVLLASGGIAVIDGYATAPDGTQFPILALP